MPEFATPLTRAAGSEPSGDLPVGSPDSPDSAGSAARNPGPASDTRKSATLTAVTAAVFAGLFVAALALVNSAPHPTDPSSAFSAFYAGGNTALVTAGLYLVPFAGIAFLWSMTALRQFITARTPPPSAMPYALQFLGGVLFVVLLFAGMAAAGGQALLGQIGGTTPPSVEVTRSLLVVGYGLVFVYAVRGAGMYVIATTTLLLRAAVLPMWSAVLSYLAAAFMLISTTLNPVAVLLLPAWSLLVAGILLIRSRRGRNIQA